MNNNIILMEKKLNKHFGEGVNNITKKDVDAFFLEITKNSTYTTARGYISQLNYIFRNKKMDIVLKLADYGIKEKKDIKGICTKAEIEVAIENLINPIDKFIVMAIYNGISGNRFADLINLKKSDVDFKNSVINVADKTIHMDETFLKITKDALEQKEYAYTTSDGDIKYYQLNTNSKYILKSKPMKRNKDGLEPMGVEGFKTRFKNIVTSIELETTISALEKSGYVEKMLSIKKDWKIEEVDRLIKSEKMNVNNYTLFRLYKNLNEL